MPKLPGILALCLLTVIPVAEAKLDGVDPGPYNAASGYFPRWYQDPQPIDPAAPTVPLGAPLKLALCLSKATNAAGNPMCVLPAGFGVNTLPIVFPRNFPVEAFWFNASANIDSGGFKLSYTAALEASFGSGVVAANDQVSFARIRIRGTVPVAGTYTITHPYGTEIVDTQESLNINLTRDGIKIPGNFSDALQSADMGPFLRPVGGPYTLINQETGEQETFIGDPNLSEPVVGSPNGTNFVSIVGPGTPSTGIETSNFSVSGKLYAGIDTLVARVAVNRATYSRNSQESTISVFADSNGTDKLCFGVSLNNTCEFEMVSDGSGRYFGQHRQAPSSLLPPDVFITATDNTTPPSNSTQSQPLTDLVKISQACFSRVNNSLTVEANSSDEVKVPTLMAEGFGPLKQVSGLPQSLVVQVARNTPPASVTVKSTAGGSDTESVVINDECLLTRLATPLLAVTDNNATGTASTSVAGTPVAVAGTPSTSAAGTPLATADTSPIDQTSSNGSGGGGGSLDWWLIALVLLGKVCIWTPPGLQARSCCWLSVRLLTYIRPSKDLSQKELSGNES